MRCYRLGLLLLPVVAVPLAPADEPAPPAACSTRTVPGVACWARPSDTGHYCGYYVGGGRLWHGSGPAPDQGTWGWDYGGWLWHPRILLLWSDGEGHGSVPAYRSVGTTIHQGRSSP
jgi:hypothetical protein